MIVKSSEDEASSTRIAPPFVSALFSLKFTCVPLWRCSCLHVKEISNNSLSLYISHLFFLGGGEGGGGSYF